MLFFGLLAAALVFGFAWSGRNRGSTGKIVLAGIAMLSLFTASTTGLLASFPERAPSALFFIAGGLTNAGWEGLKTTWPYFRRRRPARRLPDPAARPPRARGRRRRLARLPPAADPPLRGDLGGTPGRRRGGLLGFLGLVVPHVVRMAAGTSSQAFVVPTSALGGAALLAAADTLARTVRAPIELPVGPFMVVLGVPVFLWLLRRAV